MNDFGDRLRAERERLALNQDQLGAAGGVKKHAQYLYEKGERLPDAGYLQAVATYGVDVQFVLLGVRTEPVLLSRLSAVAEIIRSDLGEAEKARAVAAAVGSAGRGAGPDIPGELVRAWLDCDSAYRSVLLRVAAAVPDPSGPDPAMRPAPPARSGSTQVVVHPGGTVGNLMQNHAKAGSIAINMGMPPGKKSK